MIAAPSVPFVEYWQKYWGLWAGNKIGVCVSKLCLCWFKVCDRESEVALRQNMVQESWFYWFGFLQCLHIVSVSALQRAGSCFVLPEKSSVSPHFLKAEL